MKVSIDICNYCQLKCPSCPTTQGKLESSIIGRGYMPLESFRSILDRSPEICDIELSLYGEIFLHPQFDQIVDEAKRRGITLRAENGCNFNNVSDSILKQLAESTVEVLSISIDGASQDVYQQYRVGGNLRKVLENIDKLNQYKKSANSAFPKLQWQFIEMEHNRHQIALAKDLATVRGMTFKLKSNSDPSFSALKEQSIGQATQKITDRKSTCYQLWKRPRINWNGELIGCCLNRSVNYGNVTERPLSELLLSKPYQNLKKTVTKLGVVRKSKDEKYPFKKNSLSFVLAHARARINLFRTSLPCVDCSYYHRLFSISKAERFVFLKLRRIIGLF